jgi:hypothetical protein
MANMWYDKEAGGWMQKVTRPDGTEESVLMNSPGMTQARENYAAERAASDAENLFSWDRDYGDMYSRLYGAGIKGDSRPSFMRDAGGGNWDLSNYTEGSWRNQFNGRMRALRRKDAVEDADFFTGQAGGGYGLHGFNELSSARGRGGDVFQRNNAIMDMHRRGYSYNQISDYIGGKRNVLEDGPDWADYEKEKSDYSKSLYDQLEGNPIGQEVDTSGFWGNAYFIGAPGSSSGGGGGGNPLIDQPDNSGGVDPSMSTGRGFLGAYNDKRAETEARRPSVKSLFKEMEEYENE